ncbi:tetratricopeptide repeat protein [Taklimakanibacter lacteus]|uniref:tetratricopeptide repeat protein n=1 Tax=Taklimakanibacter lacteus TaxID=2268456 RepID=UPI000E668843
MSDYPFDLGNYSRPVTTSSPVAQTWFDRGLAWCYGYNHDEAVRCFEKAAKADPQCAMAWWGIAYAAGPNYNKQWKAFDTVDLERSLATAHKATAEALRLKDRASAVERRLIEPLALRYPSNEPGQVTPIWNDDYAAAMRNAYRSFPDDLDVAALFAEAIMNRTPWQLWNIETGKPAEGADTLEAIAVLEKSMTLAGGNDHPGLLHMYIHLMEMSPFPERALKAGDRLRQLVPDAGHLLHMPTHIDVLCGDYLNVVEWNDRAIKADRKYLAKEGAPNFYSLYRCHDYHFKLYGAMFLGQYAPALAAAEEMAATLTEDLLTIESPPMADWLESFVPMKMHVLIRFGKWHEIIAEKLPANRDLYCVTTAMIHYAKAVAFAASGNVPAAEKEAESFHAAVAKVPPTRYLFNNTCLDILAIAAEMMKGEIAYRQGRHDEAFAHLRRSVELDDNLPYDEPWGWMQPTRHALGALLLEQGKVAEAEAVYRADLGLDHTLRRACQHPNNVWSLHGFHECLVKLGKSDEAVIIKKSLDIAVARADVPVKASCFCRLQAVA